MERKVKVIYDDGCPTCTVGMHIAHAIDHNDSLEFIGMNTEEGKRVIQEHGLDMEKSAYVIDGDAISGRAQMMRDVLARGGVIGFLLSLPFRIPLIGNALYDLLALHRKHVTRTKT
jgi:predicted DCC family thiol-disulfide oxidoreductase YuxK